MRYLFIGILFLVFFSCKEEHKNQLRAGDYRATLNIGNGETLPFNFNLRDDGVMEIYNAEEVIEVNDISYFNDSVRINFPIYEGYIVGKFKDGAITDAKYIKESLDRVVPMAFEYGVPVRYPNAKPATQNVDGIWEMQFIENDGSRFAGKGIFKQDGNGMTGTIRTSTGDYRYLEGVVTGNEMSFSVFDGAHAFLFTGKIAGDSMKGKFYSGNHYMALFKGQRNADFELPDEYALTYLKEGYDSLEFSFPDINGNMVSLSDAKYTNKVVVVQIMGSWCPNCLDESRYYSEYYRTHPNKDLEFVALAFEYAKSKEAALAGLKRLKDRVGIEYPILLAQYGTSDKAEAQKKLPMLNHVLSYPTTIFVDKTGKVRKIHTGFNGPATGDKYVEFKTEFETFVTSLLTENVR